MNKLPTCLIQHIATYLTKDDIVRTLSNINKHRHETFLKEVTEANKLLLSLNPKVLASFEPNFVSVDCVQFAVDKKCVICNNDYKNGQFSPEMGIYAHKSCMMRLNGYSYSKCNTWPFRCVQISVHDLMIPMTIPHVIIGVNKFIWNGRVELVPSRCDHRFVKYIKSVAAESKQDKSYESIVRKRKLEISNFELQMRQDAYATRVKKLKKVSAEIWNSSRVTRIAATTSTQQLRAFTCPCRR